MLRVGNDFYIATSTFEWFPGVRLHHSRDLVHWRCVGHALTRSSQLNLIGNGDSCGVWAPALSYHDGAFYLIFTDQKSWKDRYMDAQNYLVTAPAIDGPWSDPIFLNSSGFDPSLFHDDDGRKWLVNQLWDHRAAGRGHFAGIVLQEYCPRQKRLVGEVRNIFRGTPLGVTEGPHLYKWHGYYYLVTAEGGTGWEHAVTVARSRDITGPYEVHPQNPLLSADKHPEVALQKAGHGSIIQTPSGEWYLAHLCARPVLPERRCPLGRETAIQKLRWDADLWPRLDSGSLPLERVPAPALPPHPWPVKPARDDFDSPVLGLDYATLRLAPDPTLLDLGVRPGFLRLYGQQSLTSRHRTSVVARRLQALQATVTTRLEFAPQHFQQMAGLTCIYDVRSWYYLAVTHDEELGRCLRLYIQLPGKEGTAPLSARVALPPDGAVDLRVEIRERDVQFSYRAGASDFAPIGERLDLLAISDEASGGFTGAMVGMCAQDIAGTRLPADFDSFEYCEG